MPLVSRPLNRAPAPPPEAAGVSVPPPMVVTPARSARAGGLYDRIITMLAVLGGLSLCGAAWYVSAAFTVAALDRTGWLASVGGWVWAVPALVSAVELRLGPNRRRGTASRLLWALVLGLDVFTTAWGALPWVAQWSPDHATTLVAATFLGFIFALAPEPAARAILRENV